MSKWNHATCHGCWRKDRGDQEPVRVVPSPVDFCCWCGALAMDGIYRRNDPVHTPCKGKHTPREDDDDE